MQLAKAPDKIQNLRFYSFLVSSFYGVALALVALVVVHPRLRSATQELLSHDYRSVLATVTGNFGKDQTPIKIIKVKTQRQLLIEFYSISDELEPKLLQKIELDDKRDAYFNYNGSATNLALSNIATEEDPSLLVPSVDRNLRAHLNVFRYDQKGQRFIRATPPQILQTSASR